MNDSIQAIFQNGLLRPLTPLNLPENSVVEIDVRDVDESSDDLQTWLDEFEDFLRTLDPNTPILSEEQISRESIYKERIDRQR